MVKLIAHRGWSAGKGDGWSENTLEAFKKSAENKDIKGIEIDIRRHPKTGEIVLSHDPIIAMQEYTTLPDALAFIAEQDWQVLLEFKEYDTEIFDDVVFLVKSYRLNDKVLLFGFYETVKDFPWDAVRKIKMGITIRYPWDIKQIVKKHTPDTVLLGWDYRKWTEYSFKVWWSIFSLNTMAKKNGVCVSFGIAQTKSDVKWILKQDVTTYTLDMSA